jgi:hypothetical protein
MNIGKKKYIYIYIDHWPITTFKKAAIAADSTESD